MGIPLLSHDESVDLLLRNIINLTEAVTSDIESDHYLRVLNSNQNISTGDTAWIIMCTILVFMMTLPGIMLYYSGLVRLQNVLATAMQGYCMAVVITFLWMCFGYSMTFAPIEKGDGPPSVVGNAERLWLQGLHVYGSHQLAPTLPESLFCVYQLAFAVITPSLICGAFADRMKFVSMLASLGLWHLLVYCPIAHMTWHPNGLLHTTGVLDFAGGNVVHVSAGFSALVSAIIIGKRAGFTKKSNFHPHNMLVSITGEPLLSPTTHSLLYMTL